MDVLARWQSPFILAVIFSLFLPHIPPLFLLFVGFYLSLGLLFARFVAIGGFLFGICWFFLHAHLATSWQLPKLWIKQPIAIVGQVAQIPHHDGNSLKFILTVKRIGGIKLPWWQRVGIKLSWRVPQNHTLILKQGQVIALTGKLKPAHGFANLGGFSYSKWLLLKGIRATGYVFNKLPVTLIDDGLSIRQQLFDQQVINTKDLDFKGVLLALTMGEKQFIDDKRWQVIRATGIGHLLAISGLHIGMMFMFCHFLGFWLASCGNLCCKKAINAPLVAAIVGLIGALGYSWMAGFAVTTIRALLMLSIALLAMYFAKGRNSVNVLLSTLTIILLLDPLAILSASLWLSFIAVISILSLFWLWPEQSKGSNNMVIYAKAIVKIQLVLFVCLMPLTALIFNGVSVSGSWVNLVAVPWVSFITVPLALLATLLAMVDINWLWSLADKSLELLFVFIEQPYNLSGWSSAAFMPWYVWFGLFIVLLTWVLPLTKIHKLCGTALLLAVVGHSTNFSANNSESWRVDVLDVGQGLAVAVEYKNNWFIYDLGPVYPSGFNTAAQVVEPFLTYHGVNQVDWLVLSHADSDHAGDYQYFLKQLTVNHIIAPQEVISELKKELKQQPKLEPGLCKPQQYNWQGLLIEILWPLTTSKTLSRNDSSCVIRISNQYGSLLLTGDISKRTEKQLLLANNRGDIHLAADIMLVPHHGSMSSSSELFIGAVNPQYVAFSSGFLNRYRFPRPEIVSRYNAHGAVHHVTAASGQISYIFDDKGIRVEQIRKLKQNAWYLNR